MEPGGRRILPRIRPSSSGNPDAELDIEPARQNEEGAQATQVNGNNAPIRYHVKQWRPAYDDQAPKRRRINLVDSRTGSQILPGVQQLLTTPNAPGSQMAHPSRLVRSAQDGHYYNHGVFIFQAPAPPYGRGFPTELTVDPRPLSFAMVEPELMDIFKHTWYLRQYVRQRRSVGIDSWFDHIMVNDIYGIMNSLQNWSSRYEPGTIQYPASMLYKHALWLYANRSIQPSMATAGYRQVVEDVPIFLLAASAFENRQRSPISRSLAGAAHQQAPDGIFSHAMYSISNIWDLMSEGRASESWDWERLQDPAITQTVQNDRSLVELLHDPHRPDYQVPRVRSPEAMQDFDQSRFRPTAAGNPASAHNVPSETMLNTRTSSGDTPGVSPGVSPNDAGRPAFIADLSQTQHVGLGHERVPSQQQFQPVHPRQFIAPPPSGVTSMQHNAEMYALNRTRLVKAKSMQPPCHLCGKELKNPSDAQKHSLQHSKPFHCREPGCSRNLGFATENDLQRHRKSVHNASPRIGNKIGYVCTSCPEPSDGTSKKWWPRLDNFKAHIRRKHHGADEEGLIRVSATPRRPEDTFTDSGVYPGSDYTPPDHQYNHTPSSRQHQLSITSQSTDVETDTQAATQEHQQHYNGRAQQAQQQAAGGGNGDDDEDDDEEDEEDEDGDEDGAVGPWELSKSFRSNGKRARSSPLTSPETTPHRGNQREREESPMAGRRRSRSGSVPSDSTPRAGTAVDGAAAEVEQGSGMAEVKKEEIENGAANGDADHMDVDTTAEPTQRDEQGQPPEREH